MYYRIALTFLFAVALTACGTQAVQTPLEPATATLTSIPPTQAPTATNPPPTVASTATVSSTEIPSIGISFANDVLPILNNSCNKCHGLEQIKEGLDMRTYEALMEGSFNGSVITPGNADDSFLVQQVLDGEMPKRGPKLTTEQIQIIIDWVNAGAINN